MKTNNWLVAAAAVLLLALSPRANAWVYYSNTTPDEIVYIDYVRTSTMYGESSSSYETAVVQYGFTLDLQDYEGAAGNLYYDLVGIRSESVGSGGGSPSLTDDPEAGYTMSVDPAYVGGYFVAKDRAGFETTLKDLLGVSSLSVGQQRRLDAGCIGILSLMCARAIPGYTNPVSPPWAAMESSPALQFGEVKAFLTEADANAWNPSGNNDVVLYIKRGNWNNGVPTPYGAANEVPVDSIVNVTYVNSNGVRATTNNYITKVGNKWLGALEGVETSAGRANQTFYVWDSVADMHLSENTPHIFIKRVMPHQ